jgi:hypothetical protein
MTVWQVGKMRRQTRFGNRYGPGGAGLYALTPFSFLRSRLFSLRGIFVLWRTANLSIFNEAQVGLFDNIVAPKFCCRKLTVDDHLPHSASGYAQLFGSLLRREKSLHNTLLIIINPSVRASISA